jgi:signal transduction histidine kinase
MKLRNYTFRYLVVALLAVIALWASLFYMVILDEVYDNVDDGLKNSKILILREAASNNAVLNTPDFGINQFKIIPLQKINKYDESERFISTFEYMEYDDDNEPVRLLVTDFKDGAGNPHRLTIRASTVEEDDLLEDLLTALIALYVMLVVSIVFINQLILRKVWKSFYNLLDRLKRYKLGTGNTFAAPASPVEEFSVLGAALEGLLERNEAVYASQKQFIENASHELQTPLAISLNKLELFAENNNLQEAQMIELSKISDTLNRLVRLNKSLLLLSKIENRQYADEEFIDFTELILQLVEDYEDLADYKHIKIITKFNFSLQYKMNKGLAVTLVSNLLKNAIVHNQPEGTVEITVEGTFITLKNTAAGGALSKNEIFNRFYRDSASEQSTGLGLAIVKSIADTYKLPIDYSFNGGHIFTIKFS